MEFSGAGEEFAARLRRVKALARARAAGTGPVPSPGRILGGALRALGYTRAEHAQGALEPPERLRLLREVRRQARSWLRAEAEALVRKCAPPPEPAVVAVKAFAGAAAGAVRGFFQKASAYLKNALTAAALALGGPRELSRAERESLDRSHAAQQKFFDAFRAEAEAGGPPFLDGRFPARAEQYGGATWTAAQNAEVVRQYEAGRREARRVHRGADAPCENCQSAVNLGWVSIRDLPPLGDCLGAGNCHCTVQFRGGPDDD